MKLKRTDFPWSAEQIALRDDKILKALSLRNVVVGGRFNDKLRVRLSIAGKLRVIGTLEMYQRAEAARVSDMATLFFWEYRHKPATMDESFFNFSHASAQSDLANEHPALLGVRNRFLAVIKLHNLQKGGLAQSRINASKLQALRITDLTHRLDSVEMRLDAISQRLEHRDVTVALLVGQVKTCLDAMPHINRRLDAVESGLTCSNTAQATMERSIGSIGANSLHANQSDHDKAIFKLEQYNVGLNHLLEGLKPMVEELAQRVTRIESQTNIQQ